MQGRRLRTTSRCSGRLSASAVAWANCYYEWKEMRPEVPVPDVHPTTVRALAYRTARLFEVSFLPSRPGFDALCSARRISTSGARLARALRTVAAHRREGG